LLHIHKLGTQIINNGAVSDSNGTIVEED